MTPLGRYAAAIAGGILLALAFPEPDVFPLAWVAIGLLLFVARDVRVRTGLGLGLLFGVGFFGTLLYWISIVGWVAWFLLVALQACFIAIFGGLWAALAPRVPRWAAVPTAAALWVLVEYARTTVPLGGFTWGQLAQSQHNASWILKAASWGGSWAVALLVVAANALLVEGWLLLRARSLPGGATPLGVAIALLAAPAALPGTTAAGKAVRVAIVQGNVPRAFSGPLLDKELAIIASHERLTRSLEPGDVDLVVWPESSVGLDLEENQTAASAVAGAARAVDAPMIVGGNLDIDPQRYKVMAFHVSQEGDVVDSYQKTHLVPFGEYVPARASLDWLPMLAQVPRDAVAGAETTIFEVAGGAVAPVISFEGDFGSLVRRRIDAGGRLLVVATNTSTWEESWASAQHVAFSQVRAAENGVWVVHGALSGISAFISPDGRVVRSTDLWDATTSTATVRFATDPTFYARTGDWLPLVCLVMVIAAAGAAARRTRSDVT